ncbi:hypothetical protein GCM10009809_36140 [Isoptericola hypogeus]|uniref:Uncharacterized protein n=1 Tax=Isoptericola hypogeus TaxID=300179 RepID=A0ABN2JSN2_9MICO
MARTIRRHLAAGRAARTRVPVRSLRSVRSVRPACLPRAYVRDRQDVDGAG